MKLLLMSVALTFSLLVIVTSGPAETTNAEARATFVVHCYTVGEHALMRQPGVISVEPGWRNFREVDRVVYDPAIISVGQMEQLLRQADTYVSTVEVQEPATGAGEQRQ